MLEIAPYYPKHPPNWKNYSAVINVADAPCFAFDCPIPHFWFPTPEMSPWGYAPFYGAIKVTNRFSNIEQSFKPLLYHCHAGVNRSRCVALAVLQAKGFTLEQALDEIHDDSFIVDRFNENIKKGFIPADIIEFLKLSEVFPEYSIDGLCNKMFTARQKPISNIKEQYDIDNPING